MTEAVRPPAISQTNASARPWVTLTRAERKHAAFAAVGVLAVLTVAAILTPDERGIGTHQQLGLPPCAAETLVGIPCPFCGMTTSFSHMAHGDVSQAIVVQPAGALGFVLSAVFALGLLAAIATGKAPRRWKAYHQSPWVYAFGIAVIGAAWVYKVLTHTGVLQL